jgi:hypothetical protein
MVVSIYSLIPCFDVVFQNEWLDGHQLPTLQFKVIVDGNAYTIDGDLCATCGCLGPYIGENKKPFNGIIMKMTFQKSLIYGVLFPIETKIKCCCPCVIHQTMSMDI